MAAWAEDTLLPRSDFVIDLHSGGNRFLQQPFAVYSRTGGRVDRDSAGLAKACALPWIWSHSGSILENALITAAARKGKPAVLLEIGGEGKAEVPWIDLMAGAVRGALGYAGLLDAPPGFLRSYRVFEGFTILRNEQEGLWERSLEPGAAVLKGAPVGRVTDLLGRALETVTSTLDGAVAGICTYGYLPAADYVAELASEFHEEGPP